jgi:hydrogenase-4 component B
LGVLLALAQHDLKRLLAYHSVENIGIIALGLGVGLVGLSLHSIGLALLGFGGGLLHVANHALFKGLLFLGAGSVAHGAHTRDMDHLGGLVKRMPWTGLTFLVGAAAISGLPPLNGFISELLVYLGAYQGATTGPVRAALPGLLVIAGLALIGGLAAACFTKAFGIVFLGEPRTAPAAQAVEAGWLMRGAMLFLAAGCVGLGLGAPFLTRLLTPALAQLTPHSAAAITAALGPVTRLLAQVVWAAAGLLALVGLLIALRRALLSSREVTTAVTWDCGYARPTVRMQYTASSLAQPLVHLFRPILRPHESIQPPDGLWPKGASLRTETPDPCHGNLYEPAFRQLNRGLSKLRWVQQGKVQVYVLYLVLTLLALLVWGLS